MKTILEMEAQKAKDNERLLWDIHYKIAEAVKGDENDKQMAIAEIETLLKENNIFMPF